MHNVRTITTLSGSKNYLQFQFSTAVDVANSLSILFRNPVFAVKTQPGAMECSLTALIDQDNVFFSISANRSIFFCGDKKDGVINFSCTDASITEPVNNLRNFSNDLSQVATQVLGGFTNKTNFRLFHLPANSRILNFSGKRENITHYTNKCSSSFEGIANQSNAILPSVETLNQFRSIVKSALRLSGNEATKVENYSKNAMESLAQCFDSSQLIKNIPLKETQRHVLCKDLVAWGYDNVDVPLSLEVAIEQLHTTRSALSRGCKETMGIGPMEILRYIRLEHVRKALGNSIIRNQLSANTVERIREHYGFQTRGNFAALYRQYFEENPSSTMKWS
ncbi:helix-turn-helix transcriptional regulator [Synechococcus sp. WH 8020]|uniref:helix-turn-helix transcriptional regulator n=1 Tax=Synechococcus sp. (strain WH8020) TaxID=32052 RepID=UPI000A03F0CB|nr:helix-turn-helix transcriptional regulator [Synechococcus sp. WH 8020]